MKKKTFLLLCTSLIAGLCAGCGGNTNSGSPSVTPSTPVLPSEPVGPSEPVPSVPVEPSEPSVPVSPSLPEEEKYDVHVEAVDGVTLTLSTSQAKEGDVVTVTVGEVAENKKFKGLSASIDGISFATVEEGKEYTFAMPAESVTIQAVVVTLHQVSKLVNTMSSRLSADMDLTKYYEPGEEVSFLLTSSYDIDESMIQQIYVHANQASYKTSYASDSDKKALKCSFVMPEEDVSIVIVQSYNTIAEEGYSVTVQDNEHARFYGYHKDEKYTSLSLKLMRDPGYVVEKVEYSYDGGSTWTSVSSLSFYENAAGISLYNLTANVVVRVTGEYVGMKTISYTNASDVTVSYGELPSEGNPGDSVSFSIVSADSSKKLIGVSVKDENGADVASNFNYGSLTFTMPKANVVITFEMQELGAIQVAANEHVSSVSIRPSYYTSDVITHCAPNETFFVFVTLESGYVLLGGRVNGGELMKPTNDSYYGTYISFMMPASGDAEVSLEVAQTYQISSEFVGGTGKLTVAGGNSHGAGETVNFTVSAEGAYEVESVSSPDVEITDLGHGSYSFVMPEKDVAITVNMKELPGTVLAVTVVGDFVSRYEFVGNDSEATLLYDKNQTEGNVTSTKFVNGESISIYSLELNEPVRGKEVVITVKDSDPAKDVEFVSSSISGTYVVFNDALTFTETSTGIEISLRDLNPVTVTLDNPNNVALVMNVDGVTVDTLQGNVFPGSVLSISCTTPAPEGKAYVVQVLDADGKEVAKNYSGNFEIKSNIAVYIKEVSQGTLTVNYEEVDPSSVYMSFYDISSYTYYNSGDVLPAGKTFRGNFNNYGANPVHVEVTLNGTSLLSVDLEQYGSQTQEFSNVEGELVVTFSLKKGADFSEVANTYTTGSIDLVLNADGTGTYDGNPIESYTFENNEVCFTVNYCEVKLTWNAADQTLIGTYDDFDNPVVSLSFHVKQTQSETKTLEGVWKGSGMGTVTCTLTISADNTYKMELSSGVTFEGTWMGDINSTIDLDCEPMTVVFSYFTIELKDENTGMVFWGNDETDMEDHWTRG